MNYSNLTLAEIELKALNDDDVNVLHVLGLVREKIQSLKDELEYDHPHITLNDYFKQEEGQL